MKENIIKVSIIIPCYNVEKYLEKCLLSVCKQSLKDIEIITINDGSTDGTLNILRKYEKKYKNLIVINKKNEGVSKARNEGLKIARGEYIGFLDSDDYIKENMYQKLYEKAKNGDYDIVSCNTKAIYPDKEIIIKSNIVDNQSNKDLFINAYAVIWNKIYKKDILKDISFKEGMNFCEDVLFLYMVYSRCKKIGNVDMELHNYLQREGSLTYVYNEKIYQVLDCMDYIIKYYKDNNIYEEYQEELEYSYVRYLYGTFIKRLSKTKIYNKYIEGYNLVKNKVKKNYPLYRKNKYIRKLNIKNIYFIFFNKFICILIYIIEKNRMN